MGGEGLEPNTNVRIQWDAWNSNDNFFIEYSIDGGNTWSPISTVWAVCAFSHGPPPTSKQVKHAFAYHKMV